MLLFRNLNHNFHRNLALTKLETTKNVKFIRCLCSSVGCHHLQEKEITSATKHEIERFWSSKVSKGAFDENSSKPKAYILSMFPYPSGALHMGHVRVYTISDAMARFYKMNGRNVIHPMGWDAFGLPAENAAIQRKIPADTWTKQNIDHMRQQLKELGCAFDWDREFATCDPEYYKWTQKLFLMLHREGLAYQKEALVNWDPVDKTVLADEQVDANGCSWRSGAKVEKKLLKQWFVKTTQFANNLLKGLDDPILEDWRDIIKLQQHWIGECDGYGFEFPVEGYETKINVWTRDPTNLTNVNFIALNPEHVLVKSLKLEEGLTKLRAKNPFTDEEIPLIVTENVPYPDKCDTYLGVNSPEDQEISKKYGIQPISDTKNNLTAEEILQKAQKTKIGGHLVSSKLKDWLISRQRFWGTPIPVVHCSNCGAVPVPEEDLPVELPTKDKSMVGIPLSQNKKWLETKCPNCQSPATRETDTMDTFVDSSWYFLRFLDPKNTKEIFDEKIAKKFMPVDLYVGGKEHAVLHMYYARFVNHFLHSKGLVPHPEPFKRLLVQGMVMGQSYRVKGTGKYLREDEVEIIDAKKGKAVEKATQAPVIMEWEKMSKSKFNGVDPAEMIKELGCDSLRLIMLADVSPTSHRNWSSATFNGVLFWQNRIWMTINEFVRLRKEHGHKPVADMKELEEHDARLLDSVNFHVANVTFTYRYTHQLSVGISRMQSFTNAIRKTTETAIIHSPHYERSLAALLTMIAPMAPHFTSELWSRFISAPHMKFPQNWSKSVLEQTWPEVDADHELTCAVKINCIEAVTYKFPRTELDQLKHEEVLKRAMKENAVLELISNINIQSTRLDLYPGCHAVLHIFLDQPIKAPKKEKKGKKKVAQSN
ncbi:leucine--tRNA ligase, mitochondrial [Culicoides brevitarsis]|uniref:leucine--tRNA ligase, mitochondrial n=1 Tax=Culicoides brevitarsis TaxID=469753 RepID=UPI00307BA434